MRDITLEDTFRHQFTTRAFGTGIPSTLTGGVLSVLEENNATPITAGVSVSLDRASVTGLHEATIVATAANGYENGKSYAIYVSTGTVAGVSAVGEVVHNFTIGLSAAAIDLANGTDGLGALKTLVDTVNTDLSNGTDGLGALKALIDTVNTDLSNGTDGLGALKTLIDTVNTDLSNPTDGLGALKALIDTVNTDLSNGTDGLGALKTLIDTVNTDLSNGTDGLGALKTLIDTVNTDLSNPTDGLGALKTLIDTVNTDLSNGTDGLGALKTLIDALNDISTSQVLTQVNAALDTAISELGVAAPTATPTLRTGLMLMYMALRNQLIVQTSGTDAIEVYNDAGTKIAAKTITDDGSDYTEAKMA